MIQFFRNIWNAQRNARDLEITKAMEEMWFQNSTRHSLARNKAERENAALRSQITQRGADGKFIKKRAQALQIKS